MATKSWRDYSTDESVNKEASNQKTGGWRDYSNVNATADGKTSGGWRDYSEFDTAGAIANNLTQRVNEFLKNHNTYISDHQKRNSGRKYNYEDSYVSDSADWLATVSQRKSELDAEADAIISYLDQNKGYLDASWAEKIKSTLSKARETNSQIVDYSTKDHEWWSGFGDEELVGKYGSAEEAYKYYQRDNVYSKKYDGQTYADLSKVLETLGDGEEKEWLSSYASSVDYNEKSTFDLEAGAKEVEELRGILDQMDSVKNKISFIKNTPSYAPGMQANASQLSSYESELAKLEAQYGSYDSIKSQISQKDAYLNTASRIQKGAELAGVTGNQDFAAKSGYVSTKSNDWHRGLTSKFGMGYDDLTYEYINGKDNGMRSEIYQKAVSWDAKTADYDLYDRMTDEQISIYNYHYATGGKETAEEYLDSIIGSLSYQEASDRFSKMKDKTALEMLFAIEAGVDQFQSGIKNLFSGDDYIPTSATQYTSSMVREDLADNGFKLPDWMGGASIAQGAYDLATTTVNMAPSIMVSAVANAIAPGSGAVIGSALMGASSAGNAYQEALNLGYDKSQARAYSTLVGASEAGLQYLLGGIGKLGGKITGKTAASLASKFDNAFARLAVKYGMNMLSEGGEEYLQEILTPMFKNLALGTDEEIKLISEEAIYSFLLGAISSGFMEGTGISSETGKGMIGNLIDMSSKNKANIEAVNLYGGSTSELIQEGLQSEVGSESRQFAEVMKRKTDKGKSMTGYEIRQQVQANEAQFTVEDYDAAVATAKERLTELGEAKDVGTIAKLAAKKAAGQELTRTEKSTLARSQYGAQVAKEMTTPAEQTESGAKAYNVTYKSITDRVGEESHFGVSESGQTTVRNEDGAVKIAEVLTIEDGQMTVKLDDGREVDAGHIDFASEDESRLYSAVAGMENMTPAAATALVHAYDPASEQSVTDYVNGIDEAYTYGYYGYPEADLKAGNFTSNLTSEQMMSAYHLGKSAKKIGIESKSEKLVKMRTAAEAKAVAENATTAKTALSGSNAEVYFKDGNTTRKFEESGKYDDRRMAGVNYAKFLSKLGIGSKYYFFESYIKDGKRVYKDANGNEVNAPNGFYKTDDGSIYIDLNAGNRGDGFTLYTLGHELTHFIKQWSADKFQVLADFLIEEYGKTDMSMHQRVLEKQSQLEKTRGEKVSYDEAFEEVVADAMSTMLSDGNLHEKLAKLKAQDKGLFNKIKKFFEQLVAKFKKVYAELTPDQKDAQDVQQMKEAFDRIQTAFAEALVEASDNFQASEAQKNTTEDGGDTQYSLREFEDGTRFVDVEMDAHTFDGMTVSQMNQAVKAILMERFAGKVVGIDNRVFVNGDSVNEYLHPSKSIDLDTRKAKLTAAGELDNLLDAGEALPNKPDGEDGHVHPDAIDFSYFKTIFKVGNEYFEGIVNIKNNKRGKLLKDVTKIKNITQDIVSSYGQNPKSNFLRDVSMDSIRREGEIVKYESTEEVGMEVDEKTESVSPAVMNSERTWTESDYVQERDKAAKEIAKAIGVSEKKAKDYIDSINSIAKMIAEDRSRLDYFSSPGRSSFVDNSEYGGSFDFSTLCKKRRLLTGTFTAIQKALPNTALTADEILDIRNRMKEADLEVSCGLCYVEGSRANMGQFAKEFLRLYKQYYPDAWQPNMADVNTPDGIEWVRINHPECYEQYEYFWNHYGTLKEGDKNLFASQQKPKLYQLHTEYKGEILNKFKNDDKVEDKNLNGGIRIQSFSDFEIVHLIDTMQIIMDMSRVGLAGQAYTKVPDFAWALGDTGLKINLSLIAKGVDADGKLIFDDVEGMPIADAMKLRERYSKNVGTILVAFNDEQLLAAMADDRVDFIIPFHRSQWKKSQYGAMGLPAKTKDYTFMQNEKYIKPQFHEYRGRMVKDKATNYMPNEYWDFSKTGKENAEAYLEMCARNNKRPKFYKLLTNNGDGSYSLKADGSTDGYWKLLIDFKMYDNEGNGSPQLAVKPDFNMEEANRMLETYKGGHSNFPVAQGIVDDFVKEYKKSHKGQKFSERTGDSVSNRSLLANAFEGITQNSNEYKLIQEYKSHVAELNSLEAKLSDLNREIRKIRFTEGEWDSEKLRRLEDEANKIAKAINQRDKKLLSLEASEPLRKVIEREKTKAKQKTMDHVKEIQQNKKVRAEQTELRHKIRKAVRDLDKILNRGNKKLNVKEDMKGFVSKALELADYLFTDHVSNDELIRRGINPSLMRGNEAELVKETEEILSKLYDHADSLSDEEFTRLDAKRQRNLEKLRDLLTKQRNERLNTPVYKLFNDLVTEYASLKNSKQEAVKAAYNAEVERFLRSYIGESNGETDSDRKTLLENMRVADMTTEELWKLHNAYQMVLHAVRTANKLFVNGNNASIEQMVTQIVLDFGSRKIPDKKMAIALQKLGNKIGWNYEKLYYALDRIGSEAFTELIMNLANSENIVMQDVMEAAAFRDEMVKKYGFNNLDVNKEIDREFLDHTGKKFKMTLGQLMSLYAYSRRNGAWDHIEYGGFVFGKAALTNPKPADSYKLSKEQCEAITSLLTKEQKGYVEDMQKFLSETMGGKGNEVSMMLYGIKMFGEKNYFPIHIAGQFKAQAQESQAKAAAGFGSMSNAGFTHAQNPNAKAPFVLEGFNEVWSDHVNEMSRYHGTVPALEDLRRVMNRSSYSEATADSTSVKVIMENHLGKEAVEYFDNLYREANTGAITDKLQATSKKLVSLFRKNSVAYKWSVLIQQPASLVRAFAVIDKKYFGGIKGFRASSAITSGVVKAVSSKWNKAYANAYNEMLKYAPGVTMAKEIGGFDTATGGSIRSYLLDTGKSFKQKWKTGTALEKGKAMLDVVDDNAIANLPNVADKIAWIEIWNACKRETLAKHKDLAPNSEEFMKIVGDRFTEVIRATQVYDSIFAKSPMLKSKYLAVQYLVSFMNEPNTVANMAESAVRDFIKGDRMTAWKKAHVLIHAIIFTNVLKSIIYAMHDDDEDETYIEKYIEAVVGNVLSDFNPLSYIPYGRDALSLMQGYDVERPDVAIIGDAIEAISRKINLNNADTENMTEEQLLELDKKVTEANWKLVESLAAFVGIPIKNVRKDIMGVLNIVTADPKKPTALSLKDTVLDAVIDSIPFMGGKSKTDKLYAAIIEGDTEYINRLRATYKTEDSYHTAVRKALRENDPRIKEAAQAQIDGDPSKRVSIAKQIIADGFSLDDVVTAINSEISAMTPDKEPEAKKEKGVYTAADVAIEAANGDWASVRAIKDDIIQTAQKNGKTKDEAEEAFESSVRSEAKEAYLDGSLNDAAAKKLLVEYTGMGEDEAASKVSYWAFCKEHKEYKDAFTESNVAKYYEFAEPAGIPVDVYVQFINGTKGLADIKDEWGDVVLPKQDQVKDVIHALPLTRKQKDALYLSFGYAESGLWNVPW